MSRLVVHAGFHKTGTSSVQAMLRSNRKLLDRHLRVLLKEDFEGLTDAARQFSIHPSEDTLATVGSRAARVFRKLDRDDPRPILMSSEDLSGHMPGRRGLDRYNAAPLVMAKLEENARYHFGDALDLQVFFSTRAAEPWLRSSWWQTLRATRLTDDLETFSRAVDADLDKILAEIRSALPQLPVHAMALEDSATLTHGPLTPLLALTELAPEVCAQLTILPPSNVQSLDGMDQIFLALNRSGLSEENLRQAKTDLRHMATKQEQPQ